jgi:ABC-2 type transport system ATP-binding protein
VAGALEKNNPILVVENLRKDFGSITALGGIDILLEEPGVYGFLGPNGAGKTTTFKLICALLRPTAGRILVDGVDVHTDTRKAVGKLGILFDATGYYPYLTGRENLQAVACWLGTVPPGAIGDLLSLVGLGDAADRRVSGYSWGMKQRLGMAAALLSDPRLVLLDEPTNGLDPAGIADVRRMLPRMAYDQGRTVFLSSHRMEEVEQVCDHVTIIHKGEIVASGRPDELASERRWIEIDCGSATQAEGILKRIDGIQSVERTGGNRIRILTGAITAGRINQMLIEGGIGVERVVERRESLEETFFRLTGEGENET